MHTVIIDFSSMHSVDSVLMLRILALSSWLWLLQSLLWNCETVQSMSRQLCLGLWSMQSHNLDMLRYQLNELLFFAIKAIICTYFFSSICIRLRRRWSDSGSEFNFCIPLCWDRIDWILLVSWQTGNTCQLEGGRLLLSRSKYQVAVWLECLRYIFHFRF